MAFLPRAGRHAVGPVWPLPAVPAAWHRVESLIKQPLSALCPPGHPQSLAPDPMEGPPCGLSQGAYPSRVWKRGDRRETLFLTPRFRQPLGWSCLIYGLSFLI